jgi:hypothetical protein
VRDAGGLHEGVCWRTHDPSIAGEEPYIWLGKKLLGIVSLGGRWALAVNWRKICAGNGIDSVTGKVERQSEFETQLSIFLRRKEHLLDLRAERKRARTPTGGQEGVMPLEPLSPPQEMLRAMRARLGPSKASPKPLSLPPAPASVASAAAAEESQPEPAIPTQELGKRSSEATKNTPESDWFARRYGWAQRH